MIVGVWIFGEALVELIVGYEILNVRVVVAYLAVEPALDGVSTERRVPDANFVERPRGMSGLRGHSRILFR